MSDVALPVSSSLVGDLQAQLASGNAIAGHVQTVANQVGDFSADIASLAENGVTVGDVSPDAIAGALAKTGSFLSKAGGTVGQFGKLVATVASTTSSGAAMGGPYGAAIGAVVGAVEGIAGLDSQPAYPPPSSSPHRTLDWLHYWARQAVPITTSGDILGQHFYDYVGSQHPDSICTPWLYGGNPGGCSSGGPAFNPQNLAPWSKPETALKDMPDRGQDPNLFQTALSRIPDPSLFSWNPQIATQFPPLPGIVDPDGNLLSADPWGAWGFIIHSPNNDRPPAMLPNYAYLFALGTVFTMLAGGASDQAIAAELLQQMAQYSSDENDPQVAAFVPYVELLADEFLKRLPPAPPALTLGHRLNQHVKFMGNLGIPIAGQSKGSLTSQAGHVSLVLPPPQKTPPKRISTPLAVGLGSAGAFLFWAKVRGYALDEALSRMFQNMKGS